MSKKITFILVGGLIVIAFAIISRGSWFPSGSGKDSVSSDTGSNIVALSNRESLGVKDSDHDGLQDWEELLWGTNVNNRDSDGDGTTDGVEVRTGRDPNTPGPDDHLPEKVVEVSPESPLRSGTFSFIDESDKENITDSIAINLTTNILRASQSGSDPALAVEEISSGLNKAIAGRFSSKAYAKEDLRIIRRGDESQEELELYGKTLVSILRRSSRVSGGDDLLAITDVVSGLGGEAKLIDISAAYYDAEMELLGLRAPEAFTELHLRLLNGFSLMAFSASGLSEAQNDPALNLILVNAYSEGLSLISSIEDLELSL